MPAIYPIRAIHYNSNCVSLSNVIIPPYDAVPKDREAVFLQRSPYNFAHILLPNAEDPDYQKAASRLSHWKETGILVEALKPSFFLYRQTFAFGGRQHTRDTLMAGVKLHEFDEGVIRPHERTYPKFMSDRLQILRSTRHQMSHIFGMVKDPDGRLRELFERWSFHKPFLLATDDEGTAHALWQSDSSSGLLDWVCDVPLYIVDGHHRYGSALDYAKEVGALGSCSHLAGRMMFCIANVYDPALVVYPTHRLVRGATLGGLESALGAYAQRSVTRDELQRFVSTYQESCEFVIYHKGRLSICSPLDAGSRASSWGVSVSRLAVAWSDWQLLPELGIGDHNRGENVLYERDFKSAWDRRDDYDVCIFHAPISPQRVCEVADEKRFMPQKTTYFYPKLAAGFVLRGVG